jgi:hypothetical protein
MTQVTIEKTKPDIREEELLPGVWTEFGTKEEKHSQQTKNVISKSVGIIVRVLGLFMGYKFTTPVLEVTEKDPLTMSHMPL